MATLMEFAAMQLERPGTRALGGTSSAMQNLPDPVAHWGSEGRKRLDADGLRTPDLLLISAHPLVSLLLKESLKGSDLVEEGIVMFGVESMRGSNLGSHLQPKLLKLLGANDSNSFLIADLGSEVEESRCYKIAKALSKAVRPQKKTVILGCLAVQDCGLDLYCVEGPELRQLVTTASSTAGTGAQYPPLETGAVVGGIAAAALSRCQMKDENASLILVLTPEAGGGGRDWTTGPESQILFGVLSQLLTSFGMSHYMVTEHFKEIKTLSPGVANTANEQLYN